VLTGISLKHSPEDVYAGTMWGALQALDAGITTIADWAHNDQSPAHADADLRGLRESGIRGYFLHRGCAADDDSVVADAFSMASPKVLGRCSGVRALTTDGLSR
jgi:hypothetical protein